MLQPKLGSCCIRRAWGGIDSRGHETPLHTLGFRAGNLD